MRKGAAEDPAAIFAFDLLWLDGQEHRNYPLVIRKGLLRHVLRGSKRIIYATHLENSAAELWALAKKFELEGVIAKDGALALRRRPVGSLAEDQDGGWCGTGEQEAVRVELLTAGPARY